VVVRAYAVNFYGTDYSTTPAEKLADRPGLDSDRLSASWELRSPRVEALAAGQAHQLPAADEVIEIPPDWGALIKSDVATARAELLRVRSEFQKALAAGLVCRGFDRQAARPRYLLYRE